MATTISNEQTQSSHQTNSVTTPSVKGDVDVFSPREVHEFHDDDAQAGKIVGRILCTLFAYSFFVMIYVIWWTLRTVSP